MTLVKAARFFGVITVLSCVAVSAVAKAARPRRVLTVPEHVPQRVRAELKARMTQHGATMAGFVEAVVLLDRPLIQSLARPIADEEVIAPGTAPMSEGSRLLLPRDFFLEQIALSTVSRQLAAAAERGDDEGVSDRFAALTRTCVACHSSYLHGRPGS